MRIAVLVKQIPAFEEMTLGPDGRLVRDGIELEMSAYCRRAVSKGCELAAANDGSVTVITLGPPSAEDTLREAIAWGLQNGVADISGVIITDPACAGSDTLATARAVAAAIRVVGPFDLILTGKNSVDADTGQVPPQVAQMLDLPFATGVKQLELADGVLALGCEHDDEWVECEITLPAVVSCAERLCEPSKVDPEGRASVPADLIRVLTTADLGEGPWGQAGSPTWVGDTRVHTVARDRLIDPAASLADQVTQAVAALAARGALVDSDPHAPPSVTGQTGGTGPVVVVIGEPDRERLVRELLGASAELARQVGGSTVLLTPETGIDVETVATWGADHIVSIDGVAVEEDLAAYASTWAAANQPWAVLTGSTAYGREVAARVAAHIGAGLTGDAVDLEVADGRLVSWKPAFGGQLVAAIHASSPTQMATVRAGILPLPTPREKVAGPIATIETVSVEPRNRVRVSARRRVDDLDLLADAEVIVGIGQGVHVDEYGELDALVAVLRAELGCTRKVTDKGWMPHARQIGITGRSVAPRLFVMIGASGKFNFVVGLRSAETVLAINPDPNALCWDSADVGIVGDWHEIVPLLAAELQRALG